MRVPTRSAGTRSGVNCRRLNEPPSTSATVLTVSVFASPGTPSSSTWPPARSATRTRSSIASWPTITRLISNSADSSASCAARAERGSSSSRSSARRRRSSDVTRSPFARLRTAHLVRLRPKFHSEGTPFAATFDQDAHLLTRPGGVDGAGYVVGVAHRRAVDLDDPVAGAQPAAVRGTVRNDVADRGAALRRVAHADAQIRALDLVAALERGHDALDLVDRHREADARVVVAALGADLRVDADHAALAVEQRAAGVAGVDRGVGLDRARDREAVGRGDRAAERRHDAAGDAALEPERAADRDRRVAGPQVLGRAELERLQAALDVRRVDFQQRKVD